MIVYINGNLLTSEKSNCIIVHGCNPHVMGAGIAKQIKCLYPKAFNIYCLHDRKIGTFSLASVGNSCYIVNAITQETYGRNGKHVSYDAIRNCFESLVNFLDTNPEYPKRIIFPKIGAGLGGGDWNIIEKIIDETVPDTYEKICYYL